MIGTIINKLLDMQTEHMERNALRHLSDRMLADIGLTRAQAEDHALNGSWDAPATWKAPRAEAITTRLPRASVY